MSSQALLVVSIDIHLEKRACLNWQAHGKYKLRKGPEKILFERLAIRGSSDQQFVKAVIRSTIEEKCLPRCFSSQALTDPCMCDPWRASETGQGDLVTHCSDRKLL